MPSFIELMRAQRPVFGCFAFLSSPAVVEILALGGFDFVIIDREHAAPDWSCTENMIRAAQVRNISALVRVARNERDEILHALECGADGVVVPGISSAAQARAAVDAMRFAPEGSRGVCPLLRAASYGAVDYPAFRRSQNAERALLLLIEDMDAAQQIDTIAAAAGPNAFFMLGRSDLAGSMGHFGEPTHPEVVRAADAFIGKLTDAQPGSAVGMGLYSAAEVADWHAKGCRFYWFGGDVSILLNACRNAIETMASAVRAP